MSRTGPALLTVVGLALFVPAARAQTVDPGRQAFEARCARCHGADGNGGEMGPSIVLRLAVQSDAQLTTLIRDGLPARGMPPTRRARVRRRR
jgi:alcohol dehydrogenase (cytochrome c)